MLGSSVRAPEIDRPGLEWFNVPKPLSLADLAGRLVILDFWTFCCINCVQVLPTLHRVEEAFPDDVVVIGVHSPKFAAERDPAKVSAAIARYDIRHPVVHDPEMSIWRQYAVRAWPTLVFVSPDGAVLGQASGEPDPDRLLEVVGRLITQGKADGTIRPEPLSLTLGATPIAPLLYPGKIKPLPDRSGSLWIVADAGHHQIVVSDDDGVEIARYGSGEAGLVDGPSDEACFNAPQGLVGDEDAIYVADTGNHAIRRIDRASGEVTTLAGNGRRGPRLMQAMSAKDAILASVWDLELLGDQLIFANAGTHQLGVLDLGAMLLAPIAGTGGENISDGPAHEALLAQPSGLALHPSGRLLAFADSETSAVRILALDGDEPSVQTVIGTGLFDFGHRNGPLDEALLQHPLGLDWLDEQRLVVADSYNDRVRIIDLAKGQIDDLDEGDFVCEDEVCRPLGEPAGISVADDGRILVSDTNNHRIVVYRPSDRAYRTLIGSAG